METCKRQHSFSAGNLLFNCVITQAGFYVTPSMFHTVLSRYFKCHIDKNVGLFQIWSNVQRHDSFKQHQSGFKDNHTWLMLLASTNKYSISVYSIRFILFLLSTALDYQDVPWSLKKNTPENICDVCLCTETHIQEIYCWTLYLVTISAKTSTNLIALLYTIDNIVKTLSLLSVYVEIRTL